MRRVVVAAVAVALVAATGVLARTLTAPDPQALAIADGCERSDTLLQTGRAPNWAYVYDSTTNASDSPPALVYAAGVVNSNGLSWYSPHVSGGDTPYSHFSYDMNMDVRLDAQYAELLGTANAATAGLEGGEAGRLHTEREEGQTTSPQASVRSCTRSCPSSSSARRRCAAASAKWRTTCS